jgi:hypothetical protein
MAGGVARDDTARDDKAGETPMALQGRSAGGASLSPGMWVRHPDQPGWGVGQVQSVDGHRVTVNFEEAGKVLINADVVVLESVEE